MSRTKRKPYTKSRAFDRSCRHRGGCSYCELGRQANARRRLAASLAQLKELTR